MKNVLVCGSLLALLVCVGCAESPATPSKTYFDKHFGNARRADEELAGKMKEVDSRVGSVETRVKTLEDQGSKLEDSFVSLANTQRRDIGDAVGERIPSPDTITEITKKAFKDGYREIQEENRARAEQEEFEAWRRRKAEEAEQKRQQQMLRQSMQEVLGVHFRQIDGGLKEIQGTLSDWRKESDKHYQAFLLELKTLGSTKGYAIEEFRPDTVVSQGGWQRMKGHWERVIRPYNSCRVLVDHYLKKCYVIREPRSTIY